jgi:hypothetical protein
MVDDRFIVISLSKPLRFRGNSWNPIFRVLAPESTDLQAFSRRSGRGSNCLPCRRSWVRIPSAASERPAICRSLSLDQSGSASASGRTDSGLAGEASVGRLQESAGLQAILVGSNPKSVCRLHRTSNLLPAATVSRLFLQLRVLAYGRVPGRIPPMRLCGASPVSVRKPRGKPRPAPESHRRLSCSLRCQSSSPRNARFGSRADTLRDHARAGSRSSG